MDKRSSHSHRIGVYIFCVGAIAIVGLIFAFAISVSAWHARDLPNMPHWSERQIEKPAAEKAP